MSKTDPINIANPAGSSSPTIGDDYIRTLARAVIEILQKNHYVGLPTNNAYDEDAAGEHSKITINSPLAEDPTSQTNKFDIYTKDVNGYAELFVQDENGKSMRLTRYLAGLASKIQSINADLAILSNGSYIRGLNFTGDTLVDVIGVGQNEENKSVAVIGGGAIMATDDAPTEDKGIVNRKFASFAAQTEVSSSSDQEVNGTDWIDATGMSRTFTSTNGKLCIIQCTGAFRSGGSSLTMINPGLRLIDDEGNVLATECVWTYGYRLFNLLFVGILTAGERTVKMQIRSDDRGYTSILKGSVEPIKIKMWL